MHNVDENGKTVKRMGTNTLCKRAEASPLWRAAENLRLPRFYRACNKLQLRLTVQSQILTLASQKVPDLILNFLNMKTF